MKTLMKYSALGTLALGLASMAIVAPASADGRHGKQTWTPVFEKLDADADGFLTTEEMDAVRIARFRDRDANDDGFLTLDELQQAASARRQEHGGKRGMGPDAAEFADRTARMLRFMDENGDGKVSFAEMPNYRGARMFARLDTNEDGRISKAEFDVAMSGQGMRRHAGKRNNGGFMGHRGSRAE